jgi:hypothetical protein
MLPALVIYGNISAQHLGYKQFTVDDGLAQSEVISLFQDSRGFLWAGTKFGVSRFDGNKFVTRFDSLGILRSAVRFIEEISDGEVIASSASGYVIFKPDGQIYANRYPVFSPNARQFSWVNNNKGYIAVFLANKLKIFECARTGGIDVTREFADLAAAISRYDIISLTFDSKYNAFYFSDKNFETYCFKDNKTTKSGLPKSCILQKGQDGTIYTVSPRMGDSHLPKMSEKTDRIAESIPQLTKKNVLYRLQGNKDSAVFEFSIEKHSIVSAFAVSQTGKVIIPVEDGKIFFFEKGKTTVGNLNFSPISSFLMDDGGSIWIGSAAGLLHVFPEYFINFTNEEGLFRDIQSLVSDKDGRIWAASYSQGLQYYEHGKFFKKELKNIPFHKSPFYFFPGGRSDHSGKLHFCLNPYFELIWDGKNISWDKEAPVSANLYFYDDTVTHKYFYGNDKGLVVKDHESKQYKTYPLDIGPSSISKIVSIIRAEKETLLLGGFKAVMMYDGKTFEKLPNAQHPDIPGANAMEKDYKGNIWIGNGNGIYFYDNKKFRKIENENFNYLVLSLQCIDSTKLLIGGIKGIGILDLKEFYKSGKARIRFFDKNNGFIAGECQQNCITRDKEGYYWIGASNGIVRLDVKAISENECAPRVYFTNAFSDNKLMDWHPISIDDFGKGKIELSYNNNSIRFEFTGINFSAPENIKFSYKLEGFDKNWSKPGTERYASYTNLPPGNYIFKVGSYVNSGLFSEKPAEFRINVTAALWQRWYFYLFVCLLIAGLTTLGVRYYMVSRNRKIRKQIDYEQRLAELQFKTLRNQLEPHFIFNALNAIGSSIYQNEKEQSYDFLQRFAKLIRVTLLHANKTYRTLNEEIEFVKNYLDLEQFRFGNKFEYKFNVQEGINPEMRIPKMIIQTFAENAIKHGLIQKSGKGMLLINITTEDDYTGITIDDNGLGRTESMKHNSDSTGKGLEIIKEYISLFNRFNDKKIHLLMMDKLDDSGMVAGTLVNIKIPNEFIFNSIPKSL